MIKRTEVNIEENTIWNLIIEKIGIRGFVSVASASSFHYTVWDSYLFSLSEDIYTNIIFTEDNEQCLLSLAERCPKAHIVCTLSANPKKKLSPSASEMEVKLASPAFSNILFILDKYAIDHKTNSLLPEHVHTIAGKGMIEEGFITSQLLDKCKNIRKIDTKFVNLNLYSLWGASENTETDDPPPVLPPVLFSLPHLQSIKLRGCLLYNHSIKRLLQGTGNLTKFEAFGISDSDDSKSSSLRFQLLPLLQNKQLTSLSLRTRPDDCFILSKEILEGLKVMKLKELKLFGCHHCPHEGYHADYESGDDYDYDRDAHNVDTRWADEFDSNPSDSELELVEDANSNQQPVPKLRLTNKALQLRKKKLEIDVEESLTDSLAQFLYSQRLSLTTLELGHLLGTTSFLKALHAVHISSSSSSSSLSEGVFPHVTHLYLTTEINSRTDCCSMTAEGMSLLSTVFPSVVFLWLSGEVTREWINQIIVNPFVALKVLHVCLVSHLNVRAEAADLQRFFQPTFGDVEFIAEATYNQKYKEGLFNPISGERVIKY